MIRRYPFIPILLASCFAPDTVAAWDLDCRHSADRAASLDTSGATRVEIAARAGDLTVRPGSSSAVIAKGRACASSEALLAQTEVHIRRQGSTVQVFVQVPEEVKGIGLFYASVDLTVDVPAGLPVEVADTSGDVTIQGARVVRITDSSGDIVARDLPADLEISDSSGDVNISNTAGLVQITDSSGDIVINGARDVVVRNDSSGDVSIARVSGDVRVEGDSSGDIDVNGVGRNVEVLADTSGDVRVSGVKGTVKVPK